MGGQSRRGIGVALAGVLVVLVHVSPALAAPSLTAISGGLWSDPANWSTHSVPVNGDDVRLDSHDTLVESVVDIAGLSIRNLFVRTPGRMTAPAGSQNLTITGDISVVIGVGPAVPPQQDLTWIASPITFTAGTHIIDTDDTILSVDDARGPGTIVKQGNGNLLFFGQPTGGIDAVEGLIMGNFADLTLPIIVRDGAKFDTYTVTSVPIQLWPGSTFEFSGPTWIPDISSPITTVGTGNVIINGDGARLTGHIAGSANLVLRNYGGPGWMKFAGTNSSTGSVTVEAGGLVIEGDTALGTGPLIVGGPPAGSPFLRVVPDATVSSPISMTGGAIEMWGSARDANTDPPTLAGPITLDADTELAVVTSPPDGESVSVIAGPISGVGRLHVKAVDRTASLVLEGHNTSAGLRLDGVYSAARAILATPPGVSAVSHHLDIGLHGSAVWSADDQIDDDTTVTMETTLALEPALALDGNRDRVGDVGGSGLIDLGASDGTATGELEVRDLLLTGDSGIAHAIDGPNADLLVATGDVELDGAELVLWAGNRAPSADTFTLIDNRGGAPVAGTFADLREGALLDLGGSIYSISYLGGDGNDVVMMFEFLSPTDPPSVPDESSYSGVTPVRVLETRSAVGQVGFAGVRPAAGQTVRLHVGGTNGVPMDAAAVVLNLTAVDPTGEGFVTVWPCGLPRPTASNLNHQPGQTIPNMVISALGDNGDVCIFTQMGTDLVADLQGWYPSYSGYVGTAPSRVLETRVSIGQVGYTDSRPAAGQTVQLDVGGANGAPPDATSVVLNLTAVDPTGAGYVTVWPCGSPRPTASNLYHQPGQTIPNLVIAKVGDERKVCIFTQRGTDLVADLQGWFAGSSYSGVTPVRVLETRSAVGQVGFAGVRPAAGQTVRLHVGGTNGVPMDAAAVVLNLTAVDPTGEGFVTVWPCGLPRPTASNLNHQPGQTIPNMVISALGDNGDVCIFTQMGTDLVADLQGWYPS